MSQCPNVLQPQYPNIALSDYQTYLQVNCQKLSILSGPEFQGVCVWGGGGN